MARYVIIILSSFTALWAHSQQAGNARLEDLLKLSKQNELAGDFKEATRWLNEAATKVWEEKKYTEAIGYFNQSISLNEQIHNESGISKIESNLGMIYADMQQYKIALEHFKKSLVYRESISNKAEIISCRINMAVVLNNLKEYAEAANNLELALELATEMNDAAQMKSVYGMLAETFEKAGNQERTTHYFNLYRTFHEMIARNNVSAAKKETEAVQLLVMQAELEKKQKEIELLTATKELQKAESQLDEVSAEAQTLLDNNTKQQLALRLLQRDAELNTLKIEQANLTTTRQRWIIVAFCITLMGLVTVSVLLYRSARYRREVAGIMAGQQQQINKLNENLKTR